MIDRSQQNWPHGTAHTITDGELIAKILSDPGLTLLEMTERVIDSEPEDEMLRRIR